MGAAADVFMAGLLGLVVSGGEDVDKPARDWGAVCRMAMERKEKGFCRNWVEREVKRMFPAVVVDWTACRDRGAAERWAWAAVMEPRGKAAYVGLMKASCAGGGK